MSLKNNKKKIGDTAVDKLSDVLNSCERLDPKFNKNDTNLSWDGEIEFHDVKDGAPFSRKTYSGTCHVQVKGTMVESSQLPLPTIKYPVDLVDIKNYRYTGGTIFFVVALVEFEDYIKSKVFYKIFLPFDIAQILSNCTGKQKTFSFDEFPYSKDEKEQIIHEFILDKERQFSTSKEIETFIERKGKETYSFWISSLNGVPHFDKRAKYIYKKISEGVYQPVGKFTINEAKFQGVKLPVFLDDELYFQNANIVIDAKTNAICRIELNKGLKIGSFSSNHKRGKFELSAKCSFSEYARNLEFLKHLYNGGHLRVGELLEGDFSNSELGFEHIDEQISNCRKINDLLVKLNVKKDVKISQFNSTDMQKLYYLYECIVLNKPYHQDLSAICRDKCGSLRLLLLFIHGDDERTHLINAFSSLGGKCEMSIDKDSPRFPSSLYTKLTMEDYLTLDNIDFDAVKQSMTNIEYSEAYGMVLNWSILEMLRAFDVNQSDPLWECALKVSRWLTDREPENDAYFINCMQTIRRKREFENSEIKSILNRRRNFNQDNHNDILFLAGYAALLSNRSEFKIYEDLMSENERKEFYKWPIAIVLDL